MWPTAHHCPLLQEGQSLEGGEEVARGNQGRELLQAQEGLCILPTFPAGGEDP